METRQLEVYLYEGYKRERESHLGNTIRKHNDLDSLSVTVPTRFGEFLGSGKPMIEISGIGNLDQIL